MSEEKVTEKSGDGDSLLELARLYFANCDFEIAIEKSRKAAEYFFSKKDISKYLKAQNMLLRMHAERDDQDEVTALKEKLQDLVLKEGYELNSSIYYTLGICAVYKGQTELGLEYFQKSLAIALAADNKEDMCYAINGVAIVYLRLGRFQDALKEIYNLQVFFQILDLPELRISTQLLNGTILRRLGRIEEALQIYGDCYDLLRKNKNLNMYIQLLSSTGLAYKEMGNIDMARFYLQLAKKTIDPKSLRRTALDIDRVLGELGVATQSDFDLVFNAVSNSLVERKKGRVDFKNQFILLDLLHLFLKKPGQVYSKDLITEKLWNESYDPSVHDNKIYVTIKRLRQLIEPDIDKPRYIFRAKNGYYLNKETKIMLEQ
jgi:tetratricopeptide (TPR) repeat protein